jgi:hypothetical protein
MILTDLQITELKEIINEALEWLYDEDILLIQNRAHERSIAFRFGLYFDSLISDSSFGEDEELTTDFDYNRNGNNVKNMEGFNERHGIFPDIILHHRGFNDKNVLVIEIKGTWNNGNIARKGDFQKLEGFTHPINNDYQYGLGAFVDLFPTLEECRITYFLNGEQQQ